MAQWKRTVYIYFSAQCKYGGESVIYIRYLCKGCAELQSRMGLLLSYLDQASKSLFGIYLV